MSSPTPTTGTCLSALRAATRSSHDQLEEILGLESITRSRDDYANVIKRFWGLWHPMESLLMDSPIRNDENVALERRLRADLLMKDLESLTEDVGKLPEATLPWESLNIGEAAGILYVLEGSRHGGKVISRKLEEKLGITESTGGSFFAGVGPDSMMLWKSFLAWIENSVPEKEREDAVNTAKRTFDVFIDWFNTMPAA